MGLMSTEKLNTLSDRLSYALDRLGISQAELARRIKVKRQAVQYLCTSGTNKSKFAYDIAEALGISVDWLVASKGEMMLKESPEQRLLSEQKVVPILDWNQINAWLSHKLDKFTLANWTTIHEKLSDNSYALKLKDNSMFPRFDSETVIVIDPTISPTPPCFVVAYIKRMHDFVFRRLTKEDGKLMLYAYNETGYKQLPLLKEDKVLGCMVEAKWSVL